MPQCIACGKQIASKVLQFCGACIRAQPERVAEAALQAHTRSREPLPPQPPATADGILCHGCGNECCLGPEDTGFCGLRRVKDGRLVHLAGTAKRGLATWYHDPLPTNCVADWVCPGGTGSGYPQYAYTPGPEYGYVNLAVFLGGCSFDCLFCQNRSYHALALNRRPLVSPDQVATAVTETTACICFFGGDPGPQIPFTLRVAKLAREKAQGRILRICWETNGNLNPRYLKPMAEVALNSGGCIKFDLKAYNETLHRALTGVSNQTTFKNFAALAQYTYTRPEPPFLVASTLLVPGYVDATEVEGIAKFIASLNPEIPYTLLAFYPQHLMRDLPTTARQEAEACREAALAAGLKRVRIGNVHLLG